MHGPPTYRMRITNLPASFAHHPRLSLRQLQADIMVSYGAPTHGYRMAHDSVNRLGDCAWAFMESPMGTMGRT